MGHFISLISLLKDYKREKVKWCKNELSRLTTYILNKASICVWTDPLFLSVKLTVKCFLFLNTWNYIPMGVIHLLWWKSKYAAKNKYFIATPLLTDKNVAFFVNIYIKSFKIKKNGKGISFYWQLIHNFWLFEVQSISWTFSPKTANQFSLEEKKCYTETPIFRYSSSEGI